MLLPIIWFVTGRATVMNLFRVPLNFIVIIILTQVNLSALRAAACIYIFLCLVLLLVLFLLCCIS